MEEKQDKTIVQTSLLPFSQQFETLELEKCKTIQEILDKLIPFNFQDCKLVVTLNNEVVNSDDYDKTKLKKTDIVGVNFIPMGGGNNKGLQIAIMIAVTVATIYTGGMAGAAYAASTSASAAAAAGFASTSAAFWSGVGWSALTVGIGMVGSLLQNALMSTPKQNSGTGKDAETFFVESTTNEINKYGVVPVNLGTNRMFPKQAAFPYNENNGKVQYVRQLFTYGYGKVLITDLKFGDTEISNFRNCELDHRLNGDLNKGTNYYTKRIYQENYSINLKPENGYIVRTTRKESIAAEIDMQFNGLVLVRKKDSEKRNLGLDFELQYAPVGTDNWSVGADGLSVEQPIEEHIDLSNNSVRIGNGGPVGDPIWTWYNTFVVLNVNNGNRYLTKVLSKRTQVIYPSLTNDEICIGYIKPVFDPPGSWPTQAEFYKHYKLAYVDERYKYVGKYLKDSNDFIVSTNFDDQANVSVRVNGGNLTSTGGVFHIEDRTTSTFRITRSIQFPAPGEYKIRLRRLSKYVEGDEDDDFTYLQSSYYIALRSVLRDKPVKFADISGTGMRIQATDQLNGSVDTYNCLVITLVKSYNPETKKWENDVPSSNPADIFRYVLQSPAFAKRVSDDQIDLKKLEEWWVYCNSIGLTYNRIIDYDTSIDDVLNDICAAGVATLCKVNNLYSVIIDNERPIVKGLVTPRNSWDYSGSINYPEIPHALRIEFRNKDANYETDERIVYADRYNESNATLYERLQFPSCTDASLAYWYGRRYFATALLQPETHTFKMDFEHMTFNRGDRISLVNDVILVGVGQGRIKELLVDNVDNPISVLGFTIDDELDIPPAVNLGTRIRDNDVKQGYKYHLLQPIEGRTSQFVFKTPVPYTEAPAIGSLCAFVEDGKELDLIITGVKANKNQAATITAIDYAPARFDPIGEIPPFESNITLGLDFYKPKAPVLMSEIQTDESVMVRNSDGSLISVAVIPLLNKNEDNMGVIVRARLKGSTEWFTPGALKKNPNQLVLTGLQDGDYYDFEIIYQRQTGLQQLSDPLLIENVKFIGGSNPPHKVRNFRVTVTNGLGFFEWLPNDDIDISHYEIRFSYETEGATWENSQVAMNNITATSVSNIIHKGIYFIKAVDLLGNESVEATTITSIDSGAFKNVVEELIQDPTWLGVKDNTINESGVLAIDNDTKTDGYYYFNPDVIDLGDVYECSITANVRVDVEKRLRIRDIDETANGIRGLGPIRDFGADWDTNVDWFVRLEMNLSNDGENWSGWQEFIASQIKFRAIKFRLYLHSDTVYITPRVSIARVIVDMPDRYESKEDVIMEDANIGAVVVYDQAFWNNPAVNITIQDGAVDDRIEFVSKNNKGFTFKVFNATLNAYVKRSFDFLAAGYGRVVK